MSSGQVTWPRYYNQLKKILIVKNELKPKSI